MSQNISEFAKRPKPDNYYSELVKKVGELNQKFRMFSNINQDISSGLPFSVKDNICVKDVESTASSKILSGYLPPFNATAVDRLPTDEFGFLGKTKMDEFGFGTFGINCPEHPLNPFDERYVAGGSSSGSAVATAILKHHVSIAESTGGSISSPSSFCGVVGFTPSYGTVSRYGLIDYANSLDKIGVMARSASDARYVFDKMKGSDNYDTTCVDHGVSSLNKKKLVIIDQLVNGIDSEILGSFDRVISKFEGMGYSVEHKSIPFIEKAIPAYYIISMAEASTNLAKYTGFKYGLKVGDFSKPYNDFFTEARSSFGIEAKRRVVLGTFVRSASVKSRYYEKALRLRAMLIATLNDVLKDAFIISPSMPIKVPKVEEAMEMDPVTAYKIDYLTIPPNLAGLPHISFPSDYIGGMPVGTQLVTNHFNDYAILDVVAEWEKSFKYKFKYEVGAL